MNWSLSFGYQEWDCFAVSASAIQPNLPLEDQERDALARKLIFAQDLGTIERKPGDATPFAELFGNGCVNRSVRVDNAWHFG